jgi:hypothetical protein
MAILGQVKNVPSSEVSLYQEIQDILVQAESDSISDVSLFHDTLVTSQKCP